MEATANEPIKRSIAFTAAIGLQMRYRDIGVKISIPEARKELRRRLARGRAPGLEFWQDRREFHQMEDHEYLLDDSGFWPCLLVTDVKTARVTECHKIGDWLNPVASDHSIVRFLKYSARVGRYYTEREPAREDLLRRFMASYRVNAVDLRNGNKRLGRYGESLYSLEDPVSVKVPLVFVARETQNKKGRSVMVVITCFPFKGSGASRRKPKTRHIRAKSKMEVRRLMTRPPEIMEE